MSTKIEVKGAQGAHRAVAAAEGDQRLDFGVEQHFRDVGRAVLVAACEIAGGAVVQMLANFNVETPRFEHLFPI